MFTFKNLGKFSRTAQAHPQKQLAKYTRSYTVLNKASLKSFIKLSLRFWSSYYYLPPPPFILDGMGTIFIKIDNSNLYQSCFYIVLSNISHEKCLVLEHSTRKFTLVQEIISFLCLFMQPKICAQLSVNIDLAYCA